MTVPQQTLLCLYRYDPLNRLISHTQSQASPLQRFYCKSRLATEMQGALQHSIVQHDDLLLAQQQRQVDVFDTTLLATDFQRSVLHTLKANLPRQPIVYSPYGHRHPENGLLSLLGFNGERLDQVTGHYSLGNGYRAFNPVLMRFNCPDSWSPFGNGGLNSYAYCLGDPINLSDPIGHSVFSTVKAVVRWQRFVKTKIAARAELESVKITNTIQLLPTSPKKYSIKAGITPKQAIAARNKANEMDYLGSAGRHLNEKFIDDLAKAKRESRLLNEVFGEAPSPSDRLKMLNYIKSGPMSKGMVYSGEKLSYAGQGSFDPKVLLQHRPQADTARAYDRELVDLINRSEFHYGSHFRNEAWRIRRLNFDGL